MDEDEYMCLWGGGLQDNFKCPFLDTTHLVEKYLIVCAEGWCMPQCVSFQKRAVYGSRFSFSTGSVLRMELKH